MSYEPVDLVGVVTDAVGSPRNDGTSGSALYAVPVQLSRSVNQEEASLLQRLWDSPPHFTTMHRPGIARVSGDQIVLDGTTIDEVEQYHAKTLRGIVGAFNVEAARISDAAESAAQEAADSADKHRRHVSDVAERISFDG